MALKHYFVKNKNKVETDSGDQNSTKTKNRIKYIIITFVEEWPLGLHIRAAAYLIIKLHTPAATHTYHTDRSITSLTEIRSGVIRLVYRITI